MLRKQLTSCDAHINNQSLLVTTPHRLQFLKVAEKETPPLIVFSDQRKVWNTIGLTIIFQAWMPNAKAHNADMRMAYLRRRGHRRWERKIQK